MGDLTVTVNGRPLVDFTGPVLTGDLRRLTADLTEGGQLDLTFSSHDVYWRLRALVFAWPR